VEFLLNFAWVGLAVAMAVVWAPMHPRTGVPKGTQVVALAVAILILLPVISISDDLMAAQFPAETDSSLRWGQRPSSNHPVPHHDPVLLRAPSHGLVPLPFSSLAAETLHLAFVLTQVPIRLLNRPPPAL